MSRSDWPQFGQIGEVVNARVLIACIPPLIATAAGDAGSTLNPNMHHTALLRRHLTVQYPFMLHVVLIRMVGAGLVVAKVGVLDEQR
jgi:hypothetical protein